MFHHETFQDSLFNGNHRFSKCLGGRNNAKCGKMDLMAGSHVQTRLPVRSPVVTQKLEIIGQGGGVPNPDGVS